MTASHKQMTLVQLEQDEMVALVRDNPKLTYAAAAKLLKRPIDRIYALSARARAHGLPTPKGLRKIKTRLKPGVSVAAPTTALQPYVLSGQLVQSLKLGAGAKTKVRTAAPTTFCELFVQLHALDKARRQELLHFWTLLTVTLAEAERGAAVALLKELAA